MKCYFSQSQDEPMFAPIYARLCRDLSVSAGIQRDLTTACEAHFMENYQQLLQYNDIFEVSIAECPLYHSKAFRLLCIFSVFLSFVINVNVI